MSEGRIRLPGNSEDMPDSSTQEKQASARFAFRFNEPMHARRLKGLKLFL